MRIAFKTFGCKANSVDTDFLYGEALRRGYEIVDEENSADAYIINSCTVTGLADRDARTHAMKYKRRSPGSFVAVIGCYAQVAKDELLALPEVDFVAGTAEKIRVLDYLSKEETAHRDQVILPTGFLPESFRGSRYARANIKIQDGCNFSCSFCIIPQARGRSRSLSIDVVKGQVNAAWEQGFKEVILTGIHLAHYGWDLGTDLMSLLKELLKTDGPRIRLSTLDPFEIPAELIALVKNEERLCPHYHIALQSGDDEVLKRMRRIYRAEEFVEVTNAIGVANPDTFIGVDVIVGFPGEDEKAFQNTVSVLERSFWSKLHVFSYSTRKGTRAEAYTDHLPKAVIAARSQTLRAYSDQRLTQFLQSQVGKTKQVILEKLVEGKPYTWTGHTENYLQTVITVPNGETKKILPAKIINFNGEKVNLVPIDFTTSSLRSSASQSAQTLH